MTSIGKLAIFLSILLLVSGLVLIVANKTFPLGELPGDVTFQEGGFKFYFPFSTGFVVSGVLTGLALLITLLF